MIRPGSFLKSTEAEGACLGAKENYSVPREQLGTQNSDGFIPLVALGSVHKEIFVWKEIALDMIRFKLPKRPEDLENGPVDEDHISVQQVTAIVDEASGEAFAEGEVLRPGC